MLIGLFQNKTIVEANIKTFSFPGKRPYIDYLYGFNEEKVNNQIVSPRSIFHKIERGISIDGQEKTCG